METSTQHKYGYQFKELPIELVARDVHQPRRDFGTEGDTNRLLVSIQQYGIETPIIVSETDEPGRYLIIDGHRRYICAQKLGFETVPCRIYPHLTEAELETRRYEIQNNRRPWRPLERSDSLERIKSAHHFTSNRQLAEHLGMSEAIVNNSMQLRNQKLGHLELMKQYELNESFMNEFVRLKPKLRKIQNYEVDDIIINIFERIRNGVITSSKDLRKLSRVFKRATLNEELLARYLSDPDMRITELEQRAEQSMFSLDVENVIRAVSERRSKGVAFRDQERAFLEQLKTLLEESL